MNIKQIKKPIVPILLTTIFIVPCIATAKSKVEVYNGVDGEKVSLYGNSAVIDGVHDLPSKFTLPVRCSKAQEKPIDSGIDGQGLVYDAYVYDCGNNNPILIKKIVDGKYSGKVAVIIIPNFRQIYLGRK